MRLRTPETMAQLMLWTLRDFIREPQTLFWAVGFPILMTLTLGQITGQSPKLRATVAVLASSPADVSSAEAWIRTAPEQGDVHWKILSEDALPKALAIGTVRLGVERPWDPALRRWRFDPANTQALLAYHALRDILDKHPDDRLPVTVLGGRYIDFLLPGLLALGLVNASMWGIGLNLVELREKRLLRLMLATPLRPGVFFSALFTGRLILSVLEMVVLLAFSRLLFGISVQGSYGALAFLWLCGCAAFFGLAVLIGCRTDRSSVAQGLINAVTLPVFVISGIFFGLDNFPTYLQPIFRAFPPTLLVDALRSVISAGGGWADVAGPSLALLAMGAGCYLLGRRLFKFY
ncbi:MAG TPA: ABC transporter permease [bacterium]|jgi:ABC-2 type transport system permease protein|nr:ABC transporter permease [bacterium]